MHAVEVLRKGKPTRRFKEEGNRPHFKGLVIIAIPEEHVNCPLGGSHESMVDRGAIDHSLNVVSCPACRLKLKRTGGVDMTTSKRLAIFAPCVSLRTRNGTKH